jgi:hypothetical protein
MPCRYAEVRNNEISMIGGNANRMPVEEVPHEVFTWLAFQVTAPRDMSGPGQQHHFVCRVLDPDMDEVYVDDPPLQFEMYEAAVGQEQSEQVVAIPVRFTALQFGTYTVQLIVDERSQSIPFFVAERSS